jgi:serine/threonine protein kinase
MPRAGNIIDGKYRLLEVIGEGSMGAVWKAVHEPLGKPFALKFLKDIDDHTACLHDRFLSEARISAAVRHRSVVNVLDCGTTYEGTPYMVMEYLEGESLATRLERDPPLPIDELLRLMIATLDGLQAVHEAGILHRDLKPENIVLCPDGSLLIPKLVDFGISRVVAPEEGTRRLTVPGTTLGTPWYMAPEQAQALYGMDQRADIYAFGVVLYEALTGRLPFEHDNIQLLLMMVAAGGAAPLHTLRPDLPRGLSDVIERAMHPDPDARFATATELAAGLHAVLDLVPAGAVCRRRGDPLPDAEPTPAPRKATTSRGATLPVMLARLGFVRMPGRPALVTAGALAATVAVTMVLYMHFGEASATAKVGTPDRVDVTRVAPAAAPPASDDGPRPQSVAALPEGAATATRDDSEAPHPPRQRRTRRPPEVFRNPGF